MKVPSKYIEISVHTIGWGCMLGFPLLFSRHGEEIDWTRYLNTLFVPVVMLVMFYLNYCFLVPKYFMRRNYNTFLVLNLLAAIVFCICINRYMDWNFPGFHHAHDIKPHSMHPRGMHHGGAPISQGGGGTHHGGEGMHGKTPKPQYFFLLRDIFSLTMSVGAALAIRLSIEWHKIELLRQRSLTEQADAALKNLKAQVSPHFLLNTLNNIYSLIAFNTERAQEAVLDLAKMLRYQLYETEQQRVPLRREAEFLYNYIKLMKLRLPETVSVSYTTHIPADCQALIAPHVLICLVENAFKHGIGAKQRSYVEVSLSAEPDAIRFICRNSNHPKRRESDKTPGGIGLHQVELILQMTYADHYDWTFGTSEDGKSYTSELTIYNESL